MKRREFLKVTGLSALAGGAIASDLRADPVAVPIVEDFRLRTGPYLQNPAPDAMTIMCCVKNPCLASSGKRMDSFVNSKVLSAP